MGAESVVNANIELLSFQNDSLLFEIGATKTDQEGTKNTGHPWNVSANPENPVICTVLAMGRMLIHHPTILEGQCPIFEGSDQYGLFNRIFHDIVDSDEHGL